MKQSIAEPIYAAVGERNTLIFKRSLPASVKTVWSWLTESNLRRQWLADGEMHLETGAPFELVWRNDQLSEPADQIGGASESEHSMASEIVEVERDRLLSFTWSDTDGVTFRLEGNGQETGISVVHKALPDRETLLNIAAGWHTHLDILVARLRGEKPAPFRDAWRQLKSEYEQRIPD